MAKLLQWDSTLTLEFEYNTKLYHFTNCRIMQASRLAYFLSKEGRAAFPRPILFAATTRLGREKHDKRPFYGGMGGGDLLSFRC